MRIILLIVFVILGFLSNLLGILINPVSMLVAIPFALYIFNVPYGWGFLLFLGYYIGLFEVGPLLLTIDEHEIPILIRSKLFSVAVFSVVSFIPYSLTVWIIKHYHTIPN